MSAQSVATLNEKFGIGTELRFATVADGFNVAVITNSHAAASIAIQGAQILTWTPRREKPVIWLSPGAKFVVGKSVRGGVPVCWPWFGAHASEASFPAHGFARTIPWEVTASQRLKSGATKIAFRLPQTDATRKQWPHSCELELHATLGSTLDIDLITRNTGSAPITIGDALHTYFAVSDVRDISIHGLGGAPYLDKVEDFKRKQQVGPITINQEVDRLYLDTTADCLIDDPRWARRIRVHKHHSRSTVVWNPWLAKAEKLGDMGPNGYLNMVCVESTNAGDDVVTVAPGASHALRVEYSLERLR